MTGQSSGPYDPKKRHRLIAAAATLFSRHGFERVNVDDIAARAHVAKGTVYLYFDSKAHLFMAVLAQLAEHLDETPATLPEDPIAVLRSFVRRQMALADSSPDLFRLYVSALFGVNRQFQGVALETFERQRREVERALLAGHSSRKPPRSAQSRAGLFVAALLAAALLRGLEGAPEGRARQDEDALIALAMEGRS
jgi:AcrR family transcriptional regulator